MEKIDSMKEEIRELKTGAKFFNSKECSLCEKKLFLPTIHFMCGHTYHDDCIDPEGVRKCVKCQYRKWDSTYPLEFQEVLQTKQQFQSQAKDTQQFFKELREKEVKFNTIASYFGRGLFADLSGNEL